MNIAADYDQWRLRGPDEPHLIGMDAGDECGRYPEPDDDAPRGYRPKPCRGEMIEQHGVTVCDTCGELSE